MNGLGAIAYGAGLRDGLNPCIFMACAVFIAHGLWLKKNPLGLGWLRFIFVLTYASGFLEFNFGPAQIFVFRKEFIFAAKILYFGLGLGAFILGILFFKDWFLLRYGLPDKNPCQYIQCDNESPRSGDGENFLAGRRRSSYRTLAEARNLFGKPAAFLITIIPAALLSAMAVLWPINNYIMLLGNEAFIKGQWPAVMPLLTGYVAFSMWPLWFVWGTLSIKNLRPSLLRIFCASIFFTASSSMIFLFK